MGRNKLPNELRGELYCRVTGIIGKIEEGGLDYNSVLNGFQAIFDDCYEIVAKRVEVAAAPLLTLTKTITTPAISAKKTRDCFTNKWRYRYRDSDLDAWLPENQPAQAESKLSVQQLSQNATSKQAVESFLGLGNTSIEVLAKLLKERGHVTTLPTIESLIERQENGEDVGLQTDGRVHFFFVEDKDESVSVVDTSRDGKWYVYVCRLDLDSGWNDGSRFFFRN